MSSSQPTPPPTDAEVAALRARVAELEQALQELRASRLGQEREQRLAEATQRWLIAILETTPDLVGYIGLDGKLHYLNRAYRELRGLPDDVDLASLDIDEWQPQWVHQLATQVAIPTAQRDGIWQGEVVIYDTQGRSVPVRQTVLALRDSEGQLARLATVLHDLRAERVAAQERIALERRLREAQRMESLGVMAGGIAHDFNNILTAVLGNTELALLDASLGPNTRQGLEQVVTGVQRAAELTRQMLAFTGRGHLLMRSTDLNALIINLGGTLQAMVPHSGSLRTELEPTLPPVEADEAQLQLLLLNLVANASEALEPSQAGLITLRTRLAQADQNAGGAPVQGAPLPPGSYVQLIVEDTGRGMDRATVARSVDPFFSTKFLGRGLGLAAVQGIVRAHHGALHVASEPAVGTRISVWLPIAGQAELPRVGRPGRTGSALIVGAEPEAQEQLGELLPQLGLTPIFLTSGKEALARLSAGLADLAATLVQSSLPATEQEHVAAAIAALYPGTALLQLGAETGGLGGPVIVAALQALLAQDG